MATATTTGATEVRTETIEGAKAIARVLREKNLPLYLHSAPGIGKSDIMRQLADEDKSGFIDIRIGTMLPEDLTGIPVPDLEKRLAIWLRATFWPDAKRDGERGIISFDELSDAPRQLQSCIYRVVLDRQIGDYKLPPGWWPMAAGNRREDRAAAQSLSTALANRFAHVHIRADADAWLRWANLNNVNPYLMGFIKWRPALLHSMDGADLLAFPTPRSWTMVSKVFDAAPDMRFKLVASLVGEGAAQEVETFFKALELPDFEDIVRSPTKAMIPEEPGSRYALTSLLARNLTAENFPQVYKYIMRDGFGADFSTVVILEATKRDGLLCDTSSFIEWARKNKSFRL
jgi:hypothetical protein